jgi:hypothetical protein
MVRDARADHVSHAEILGRDVDADGGVRKLAGARHRIADVPRNRLKVHDSDFHSADAEAAEDEPRQLAAALSSDDTWAHAVPSG